VERFAALVPAGGRVLDVACGGGRHARLFLRRGCSVTLVDRDVAGVADLSDEEGVEIVQADLEGGSPWPFGDRTFDGVVVTNYLWRPRLSHVVAAVACGGALLYETFAMGQERFGHPRNPDFLLRPGELLDAVVPRLRVVAFEDVSLSGPLPGTDPQVVQRIAAVRPEDDGWRS